MDAELRIETAAFRNPRYSAKRLEVERRADGTLVLANPTPFSQAFQTPHEALAYWAEAAPDRVWLAERAGEGWRTLTYGEAWHAVTHLAGGLVARGLTGRRPILILAHNGVDHALLMYAAMSRGTPVAPVSPQYGLAGANLARLTHACEGLHPAAVFTEDAERFATGLSADVLAGLPVIAAVHGYCLGGGLELPLACHFRLAAEEGARIGLPEMDLGTVPAWGGSARLVRCVGRMHALDMILRAKKVSGPEALGMGLVNELWPVAELKQRGAELAAELAAMPPLAVAGVLKAVVGSGEEPLAEGLAAERRAVMATFGTRDMAEGMAAFMEKRKPTFTGE